MSKFMNTSSDLCLRPSCPHCQSERTVKNGRGEAFGAKNFVSVAVILPEGFAPP
ncbi:MAG: hypothetical protein GDA56_30725 [Hormoscilla sp. GM7CHS1pb]|nr:hypothetical protein [Hormoscilla sp. GM7CHS1pb]MBC6477864.1 hypothetical protein [Hormoscilla sp. GM7CHS1pb]MBC6479713.1 hypothetical protein [Hormoscilla sp. GM7CHS1pb]MBC6481210.1 hypothetical protein [Hormoscilla sp. GM7CHS1pb]MBC6481482.1 hypothetical protein [Hormoscilla sp. GM7CHS1pb]